ncbi:MAG: TetR/AcrR family transcriptional regulator [Ruminococcus sp.]|nr:TetR/AcrR family transcriptional regulator [Ruminococcus sp.]
MNKQPEVTERTRQKFVDAFWSLAKEKPINKITVSELTRRADYNRSTFYEYFLDTEDLLSYIEDTLLNEVKQTIQSMLPEGNSPIDMFKSLLTTMNEELYLLIGPNGDSRFLPRVRAELTPIIRSYLPISNNIPRIDYLTRFVHSAMFGLLQHWSEHGKNLSAEEISEMMQNLVLHGLVGYVAPDLDK